MCMFWLITLCYDEFFKQGNQCLKSFLNSLTFTLLTRCLRFVSFATIYGSKSLAFFMDRIKQIRVLTFFSVILWEVNSSIYGPAYCWIWAVEVLCTLIGIWKDIRWIGLTIFRNIHWKNPKYKRLSQYPIQNIYFIKYHLNTCSGIPKFILLTYFSGLYTLKYCEHFTDVIRTSWNIIHTHW